MCFSSLLPLFQRSNFTLRTTPLSSEFVPITLHIGQWFCVIKSVFSSTMSPMQKFLDILTHFWRSCKVWINSFLHLLQNSLLRCWILLHLLLQYKSGFWKTPGGGITTFVFIVSILFGDVGIGLCSSLIVSIVMVENLSLLQFPSSVFAGIPHPSCVHVSVGGSLKLP